MVHRYPDVLRPVYTPNSLLIEITLFLHYESEVAYLLYLFPEIYHRSNEQVLLELQPLTV